MVMGVNKMIYFSEDVLEMAGNGSISNFNGFINDLVRDHFSNDLEILEAKMDTLTKQRDLIKAQIVEIRESRLKATTAKLAKEAVSQKDIDHKAKINKLKADWQAGKISDTEYWENFK